TAVPLPPGLGVLTRLPVRRFSIQGVHVLRAFPARYWLAARRRRSFCFLELSCGRCRTIVLVSTHPKNPTAPTITMWPTVLPGCRATTRAFRATCRGLDRPCRATSVVPSLRHKPRLGRLR